MIDSNIEEKSTDMLEQTVTLLWSGGWDGTFRFLQLMDAGVTIRPIYVVDKARMGTDYELKAMKEIMKMASARFPGKVLDLEFYKKEWILENCADDQISAAFKDVRERFQVGKQYEWFALLCKHLGVKMESAVVHQYHGKVEDAISADGRLALIKDDFLPERYVVAAKVDGAGDGAAADGAVVKADGAADGAVVKADGAADGAIMKADGAADGAVSLEEAGKGAGSAGIVFKDIILPVIKLTKKDEENISREKGWIDIMEKTWFCHSPINGEPCGLCGPCDDAMNTGMEWRMPPAAQKRYKRKGLHKGIRSLKRRLGVK